MSEDHVPARYPKRLDQLPALLFVHRRVARADMEHGIAELVSWASEVSTLETGDIISCGTNHQGLGPVQDGETVTMEIESIGRLTVSVSDPEKRTWPKQVDTEMAALVRAHREKLAAEKKHSSEVA